MDYFFNNTQYFSFDTLYSTGFYVLTKTEPNNRLVYGDYTKIQKFIDSFYKINKIESNALKTYDKLLFELSNENGKYYIGLFKNDKDTTGITMIDFHNILSGAPAREGRVYKISNPKEENIGQVINRSKDMKFDVQVIEFEQNFGNEITNYRLNTSKEELLTFGIPQDSKRKIEPSYEPPIKKLHIPIVESSNFDKEFQTDKSKIDNLKIETTSLGKDLDETKLKELLEYITSIKENIYTEVNNKINMLKKGATEVLEKLKESKSLDITNLYTQLSQEINNSMDNVDRDIGYISKNERYNDTNVTDMKEKIDKELKLRPIVTSNNLTTRLINKYLKYIENLVEYGIELGEYGLQLYDNFRTNFLGNDKKNPLNNEEKENLIPELKNLYKTYETIISLLNIKLNADTFQNILELNEKYDNLKKKIENFRKETNPILKTENFVPKNKKKITEYTKEDFDELFKQFSKEKLNKKKEIISQKSQIINPKIENKGFGQTLFDTEKQPLESIEKKAKTFGFGFGFGQTLFDKEKNSLESKLKYIENIKLTEDNNLNRYINKYINKLKRASQDISDKLERAKESSDITALYNKIREEIKNVIKDINEKMDNLPKKKIFDSTYISQIELKIKSVKSIPLKIILTNFDNADVDEYIEYLKKCNEILNSLTNYVKKKIGDLKTSFIGQVKNDLLNKNVVNELDIEFQIPYKSYESILADLKKLEFSDIQIYTTINKYTEIEEEISKFRKNIKSLLEREHIEFGNKKIDEYNKEDFDRLFQMLAEKKNEENSTKMKKKKAKKMKDIVKNESSSDDE